MGQETERKDSFLQHRRATALQEAFRHFPGTGGAEGRRGKGNVVASASQLKPWEEVLNQFLAARGIPTADFKIERWLQDWLDAPTGAFWARRVRLPKEGEIYEVPLRPLKEPSEDFRSEGRLFDAKLLVRGDAPREGKAIVRVNKVKGNICFGETAPPGGAPSRACIAKPTVHYSALGVTGQFGAFGPMGDMQLVSLVPNERMPTRVMADFDCLPGKSTEGMELIVWGVGQEAGWRLSTECQVCGGSGKCPNCGGSGKVSCRKCGGSGHFGNGDCYPCEGRGFFTCRSCKGDGDCYLCHGSGVRSVFFSSNTGQFTQKTKEGGGAEIDASAVFWYHAAKKSRKLLGGDWLELEGRIEAHLARKTNNDERFRKLREECGKILEGLEKKVARDTTAYAPIRVKLAGASPRRRHGRVLYLFRESGSAAWKKQRTEPYPPGTHLDIEGFPAPEEGSQVVYEGYDAEGRTLTLSFPADTDIEPLRNKELSLKSAEMRPPEIRQRDYLKRWLDDEDSPILQAVVEGCAATPESPLKLFNRNIARYNTQKAAVEQGLSGAPLFLLKGPPGTGKTTIIVEIIRQAVQRGNRVLLTSQTHQAVENVLEKLHALLEAGEGGPIRMVHHTAQKGKASELALRYDEEAGGGSIREIHKRVERNRQETEAALEAAKTCREACRQGAEAALQMAGEERRQQAEQAEIRQWLDRGTKAIEANAKQQRAELEDSLGRSLSETERECAREGKSLSGQRRKNRRTEKEIRDRARRIETYRRGGVRAALLRGIHWFETVGNAEKKQEESRQTLAREETREREMEASLAEKQRKLDALRQAHDARSRAIDAEAVRKREEAEAEARRKSEESGSRYRDARNRAVQAQRERIRLIERSTGKKSKLPEFSGENAWRDCLPPAEREVVRLQERTEVAGEWDKLLAEHPDAVSKFLHAQTNVFLATCVGVGGWRSLVDGMCDRPLDEIPDVRRAPFFDLAIVDEAGHATFAETVIPLSMAKRAILIGDDKQLPPMEDDELETESLFTRLWEDAERGEEGFALPHLMLDTQFRMHPDIARFVSETFYRGQLKSGVGAKARAFQFGAFRKAVNLLSTSHQSRRHEKRMGTSYRNELEAEYVKEILQSLVGHVQTHGTECGEVSVAVITPYAEQVSYIRQLIQPFFGAGGKVRLAPEDVASVDKFQGGERDLVIASFVRSPDPREKRPAKMTFVQDLKRMNVAFSRARRMLILVGDIEALSKGLGNDDGRKAFAKFHCYVQDQGHEILAWERKEGRRWIPGL